MQAWERRLNDLWMLLERCHATYMEPELFRLNTNQFLQTARTVTFIIQKNKASIPQFDAWYQPIVLGWSKDAVLDWAKNSRNQIEKEGDLELHSTLELTLFFSYIAEQDLRITTGREELLRAGTKRLLRFARENLPPAVAESSAIKIERKWVANSLPEWELLQVFTYVYATMYRLCRDLAVILGSPLPRSIPAPANLHGDREVAREVRYLKLSDMNLHYQHSKRVALDKDFVPDEEMAREILAMREAMSTADDMDNVFDALSRMAEITFGRDGHHLPMLFLYDRHMHPIDMMGMAFADRTDKYIFWRNVADRMVATKAAVIATVGEQWIRDMQHFDPAEPIDEMPIIGEQLFVSALDNKGRYRSKTWEIVRPSNGSKPTLGDLTPDAAESFDNDKVPNYFAPVLKALGIPYPDHIRNSP